MVVPGFYSRPNPDQVSLVKWLWFRDDGTDLCSAQRNSCRKCDYRYPAAENALFKCPTCGEPRFCTNRGPAGKRCRYHGGKSLSGVQAGAYRTGRYSKAMPERLLARYEAASRDPELLNVRQDIALLDSRISDLLGRVDVPGSGQIFKQAREAFRGFRDALERNDTETTRIHLQTLDRLLTQGAGDYAAWEEIRQNLDQRRKLVDTEMRRQEKMGQIVTAEQLVAFLNSVASIAKRVIRDPEVLSEFTAQVLDLGVSAHTR